jgi:hypothetical protein
MPPSKNTKTKAQLAKTNTRNSQDETVSPTPEPEPKQDVNDEIEGRRFLEKHLLLCPPGEPPNHNSMATCLHQISEMAGVSKPVKNAIRSAAFLLGEMEETQINGILKDAFDTQIRELTSDMATLIEDAKEKLNKHFKDTEGRLTQMMEKAASHPSQAQTATYASAITNPPPHTNPRVAAKEGIKARQFLVEGLANTKFSHTDVFQLKTELNTILANLGLQNGKIRSISKLRNGGALVEMDSDSASLWLTKTENRDDFCKKIGPGVVFRSRVHNLIAFNVPLDISPEDHTHRTEVCEVNNLDKNTITAMRWIKPAHRRAPSQRTAHLILTFNNADAANRAITNGLYICNRRCHIERVKREPTRCLKCQGWNHFANECLEDHDTCGNCTKNHRTNDCPTPTVRKCVSCKTDDHASWSRDCPTFTKKLNDMNDRNPENTLQYIPTADPWTWTANVRPTQTQPPQIKPVPAITRERTQPPKKSQAPPRRVDTYIPIYNSYVPKYDRSGKRTQTQDRDWSDPDPEPTPTQARPKDLIDFRPLDKDYMDSIETSNNEHPDRTTVPVPALNPTTNPV